MNHAFTFKRVAGRTIILVVSVILLLCSGASISAGEGVWSSLNGPPGDQNLTCGVYDYQDYGTSLYVGTWGDGVFRWDGYSWAAMNEGLPYLNIDALAIDTQTYPSTLYAISDDVYRWDGSAWVDMVMGGRCGANALAVDIQTVPSTVYVGTECGVRYWNGLKWTQMTDDGLTERTILCLAVDTETTPSTIYAGTWASGVFKSNGKKWRPINKGWLRPVVNAILLDNRSGTLTIYALSESDGMFQYTGDKWCAINSGFTEIYAQSLAIDSTGRRSTVYCDGGLQWNGGIWTKMTTEGMPAWTGRIVGLDPSTEPITLYAQGYGSVFSIKPMPPEISPPIISDVRLFKDPFRIEVTGAYFHPTAIIYIDDTIAPVTVYKESSRLIAKGGDSLKALLQPRHQYHWITVRNPDDNCASEPFGFGY